MVRRLDRLIPQNSSGMAFKRLWQRVGEIAESSGGDIEDALNAFLGEAHTWTSDQRVSGLMRCTTFRVDTAPVAETITCTHTLTISVNGTDYKIPIRAA